MIKVGKMNESVSKGYITDYIDSDELHRIMSYTKEFGSFEDYRQIGNMTIETRTIKRYNHIGPYGAVDPSSRYWKFNNTSTGWEVVEVSSDGKKLGKPFKIKVGKMNESAEPTTIKAGGYQLTLDTESKPYEMYAQVGSYYYSARSNDGKKWIIYRNDKKVGAEQLDKVDYQAIAIILADKYFRY